MQYQRMRYGMGGGMPEVVKKLLIVNGVMFVLQIIVGQPLIVYFGLVPYLAWSKLFVWQFLTYMFLHSPNNIFHLLINMYVLYQFGSEVERMWGGKAFLQYYLITGIGAGLFHTLITPFSLTPTIGASGAVSAVMVAYAMLYPNRVLTLLLFFIIPVQMKAKTLAIGFAAISLLMGVSGSPDGVAHFAHLGGMVIGYFYMKRSIPQIPVSQWMNKMKVWNDRRRTREMWKHQQELDELRRKVDDILDKANEVGVENLTRDEQELLKKASKILNRDK